MEIYTICFDYDDDKMCVKEASLANNKALGISDKERKQWYWTKTEVQEEGTLLKRRCNDFKMHTGKQSLSA